MLHASSFGPFSYPTPQPDEQRKRIFEEAKHENDFYGNRLKEIASSMERIGRMEDPSCKRAGIHFMKLILLEYDLRYFGFGRSLFAISVYQSFGDEFTYLVLA